MNKKVYLAMSTLHIVSACVCVCVCVFVGLFTNAWTLLLNQPIVICAEQADQSVTL